MNGLEIQLYRSDDYVLYGSIGLVALLRTVFEPLLDGSLEGARFTLSFLAIEDRDPLPGHPSLVNLRGSHGYVHVRISRGDQVLYQHPHAVREVVGRPLQESLAEAVPDETHWGFGITGPGLESLSFVRPAPIAEGQGTRRRRNRAQLFRVEPVPEPELEERTLAELGAPGLDDGATPMSVAVEPEAHAALNDREAYSREVETGGFLVGHVFRNADRADQTVVQLTDVVPAERTGASLLHFTFTGESFLRMSERLSRRSSGERLVGWYHTHLFPASERMGLSSIDVELHSRTFRRPWQVAALVNLTDAALVLRFYALDDGEMQPVPYVVAVGAP